MQLLTFGYGKMRRITGTLTAMIFLLILTPSVLGASWSDYVFDANSGLGIDAVNVTAVRVGTGIYLNSTLTNANGFFNISMSSPPPIRLVSSKSTYLTDTSQKLPPITDDRVLPFNITLIKDLPGNLTGRVTDNQSSGIENALIVAIQGSLTIDSALTNSSGDYAIVNLTDGTYTLQATATGYLDQNTTNFVIQPNSTTELNFILVLATVSSTVPSAQAAEPTKAVPEKGGSPCPPGTELIERKCVAIKKAEEVPEEETEAEEVPEIEESEEPAEEQLQPPAITGAVIAEPKQVIPLAAGVLLASVAFLLLLFFLINSSFRVRVYRKLKTYSKNMLRKK